MRANHRAGIVMWIGCAFCAVVLPRLVNWWTTHSWLPLAGIALYSGAVAVRAVLQAWSARTERALDGGS
ncbi:hypothetical protein ABZX92_39820 [Lentzea sp. NPDC006480]|uniref:hypothetical protein n=1 Tax=Lentzea sp. NPDC006480 TaxID=3157176 RepID=UPI0033AFE8D6